MRDMSHSICLIKLSDNDEKKFRFFVSDYLKLHILVGITSEVRARSLGYGCKILHLYEYDADVYGYDANYANDTPRIPVPAA